MVAKEITKEIKKGSEIISHPITWHKLIENDLIHPDIDGGLISYFNKVGFVDIGFNLFHARNKHVVLGWENSAGETKRVIKGVGPDTPVVFIAPGWTGKAASCQFLAQATLEKHPDAVILTTSGIGFDQNPLQSRNRLNWKKSQQIFSPAGNARFFDVLITQIAGLDRRQVIPVGASWGGATMYAMALLGYERPLALSPAALIPQSIRDNPEIMSQLRDYFPGMTGKSGKIDLLSSARVIYAGFRDSLNTANGVGANELAKSFFDLIAPSLMGKGFPGGVAKAEFAGIIEKLEKDHREELASHLVESALVMGELAKGYQPAANTPGDLLRLAKVEILTGAEDRLVTTLDVAMFQRYLLYLIEKRLPRFPEEAKLIEAKAIIEARLAGINNNQGKWLIPNAGHMAPLYDPQTVDKLDSMVKACKEKRKI